MPGTTIASSTTAGVTLTTAGQNPVLVNAGVGVITSVYDPIYGSSAYTWTIANQGTLQNTATTVTVTPTKDIGIELLASGQITNGAGTNTAALIASAAGTAIGLRGTSTLTNFGTIQGAYGVRANIVTITNSGSIVATTHGIELNAGQISNAAGGVITAGSIAIDSFPTGAITIANAGSIAATGVTGRGVFLSASSSYPGSLITNNVGGAITGGYDGTGAYLAGPISVTNAGTISAGNYGMVVRYGVSVTNTGSISAARTVSPTVEVYGIAVYKATLTNAVSGRITGFDAAVITGNIRGLGSGTVSNAGIIAGGNFGVRVEDGGAITNLAGGTITAATGLYADANDSVTVTNAGTIIGTSGTAVILGDAFYTSAETQERLILQPGAAFLNAAGQPGLVTFTTSATNIIELAAGTPAATGTVAGLGSLFTGFQTVTIDAGAAWVLAGSNTLASTVTVANAGSLAITGTVLGRASLINNASVSLAAATAGFASLTGTGAVTLAAASTLAVTGAVAAGETVTLLGTGDMLDLAAATTVAGTIAGFIATDVIDLTAYAHAAADTATLLAGNVLQIAGSSGTIALQLAPSENFTGETFHLATDGAAGTDVTVACFAQGTRITTTRGLVPVEALREGDRAISAFGGSAPIVWLGHRRIALARHAQPETVRPVRIRAGAFASGVPARDLRLSPDHAVYVSGRLIPIRCLINGTSVVQEQVDEVTYWHVELPTHDVVLAEALPAESYLDTGNRHAFADAGPAVALHPDFAQRVWEAEACAPQITHGPILEAVLARLQARDAAASFADVQTGTAQTAPRICRRGMERAGLSATATAGALG